MISDEVILSGYGSVPEFMIATIPAASSAPNPPTPPPVIWTSPSEMELWMTGALTTTPSRAIAK